MFGYDYFNVGPSFDLNSLDSIAECIQGVLDDYNEKEITYNQAAVRLKRTQCGGNSDDQVYDILITNNPNAPGDGLEYEPIEDENDNSEEIQGDVEVIEGSNKEIKLLVAAIIGLGALILWKK